MMKTLWGLCCFLACAYGASLRFYAEPVEVHGSRLLLGDVAEIRAPEAERKRWAALDLGETPPPGLDRAYNTRMLWVSKVQPAAGNQPLPMWIGGVERIKVRRAQEMVDTALWSQALADSVQRMWGQGDSVVAQFSWKMAPKLSGPVQKVQITWPNRIPEAARAVLNLEWTDVHGYVKQSRLDTHIERWRPVAFALRDLSPEALIPTTAWESRWVNVAQDRKAYANLATLSQTIETKTRIGAGAPILAGHLRPVTLVRAGESTMGIFVGGGVRLEVPGKALQQGAWGQKIQWKAEGGARAVQAKVIGPNQVEVES